MANVIDDYKKRMKEGKPTKRVRDIGALNIPRAPVPSSSSSSPLRATLIAPSFMQPARLVFEPSSSGAPPALLRTGGITIGPSSGAPSSSRVSAFRAPVSGGGPAPAASTSTDDGTSSTYDEGPGSDVFGAAMAAAAPVQRYTDSATNPDFDPSSPALQTAGSFSLQAGDASTPPTTDPHSPSAASQMVKGAAVVGGVVAVGLGGWWLFNGRKRAANPARRRRRRNPDRRAAVASGVTGIGATFAAFGALMYGSDFLQTRKDTNNDPRLVDGFLDGFGEDVGLPLMAIGAASIVGARVYARTVPRDPRPYRHAAMGIAAWMAFGTVIVLVRKGLGDGEKGL